MSNKKILIICNNFPPIIDGLADGTHILFNEFRNRNINAHVVCIKKPEIEQYVQENNLAQLVFPVVEKWNFKAAFTILALAKQQKISGIYLQYVPFAYGKLGIPFFLPFLFFLARLNHIKTYTFFHEVSVRIWGRNLKYFFRGILQQIIAYKLCLFSNVFYSNTRFGANLLKPFKANIIFIPSNFPKLSNNAAYNQINSKMGIICFLSRCNFEFLQAFKQFNQTQENKLELIIVGMASNNFKQSVIQNIEKLKIQDQVRLETISDAVELSKTLSRASIYVQIEYVGANNDGGISTKSGLVMAAMQTGIPIIATIGDMTDTSYFKHDVNICLCNFTIESIQNALHKVSLNKVYSQNLAENAFKTYQDKSGWENFVHAVSKSF